MRPSTSKVITKPIKMSTTGWLDSDDDNDDDCNGDKQPLLNENILKQQQQYLLKGKDKKYTLLIFTYFLKSVFL